MTLYRVDLERHQEAVVYVEAADPAAAREDARELVSEPDWFEQTEVEADATVAESSGGQNVWSGGPDGDWIGPVEAPDA